MSALTLAIDNGESRRRRFRAAAPAEGAAGRIDPILQSSVDESDIVLAMLLHARSLIERIADRRRAGNVVRNRVETRRQLAKLPTRVRNDLLPAEQQPVGAADRTC